MSVLLVRKLTATATLPSRGSALAAGYDLHADKDAHIDARGGAIVDTGIAIALPPGTYGRIAPRSGLASRNGIAVGGGVIDGDYRGEIRVILFNHGAADFVVKRGDRIAQLILEKYEADAVLCEVDSLDKTARGADGFGSTGK
jgi:dUTP pyrophosphatase